MPVRGVTLLVIAGAACASCARPAPPPAGPAAPPPARAVAPTPTPAPTPAPLNTTAPQTIAYAIGLLERRQYARLLEELALPEDLREMKADGKFDATVTRFENGWGEILLGKLRRAQQRMPHKRADGALLFETMESGVPIRMIDTPVVLVERDGHWFFTN